MKFKPGDLLVYITDSEFSREVVGVSGSGYRIRSTVGDTSGSYVYAHAYVEGYYRKYTKLEQLLSEVDDEV